MIKEVINKFSKITKDSKKKELLRVDNINHTYNDLNQKLTILKDINFSISKGKFVAIIGESGSGKSTLLNLISGLEHLEKGKIYLENINLSILNDREITKLRKDKIGFIFQQYHLLNELNVIENVMLPALEKLINKKELEHRARNLLEKVGLAEKIHRSIGELSGGEMQRVGIARALINKPILLLADEPTGNLDSTNSRQIFDFLYSLCKENETTVLMVTHNRQLSLRCDQIFYLEEGTLKKVKYTKQSKKND